MRVLLLDDDRPALRALSRALKAAGHDVYATENGTHASYVLSQHAGLYQALVTDHDIVGAQSGSKLAHFLRERLSDPALVIVFTGNPSDAIREAPEGALVIPKPKVFAVIDALRRAEQS